MLVLGRFPGVNISYPGSQGVNKGENTSNSQFVSSKMAQIAKFGSNQHDNSK